MKKFIPFLVVFVLVLSVIGIANAGSVFASPKSSGAIDSPLKTLINVTQNGTFNVGGVCEITVDFGSNGNVDNIEADAEVPIDLSKAVTAGVPVDQHLLFPGCHFVFSKGGTTLPDPVNVNPGDGSLKVCFGASPEMAMTIYYYLDTPSTGRVWVPLPTTGEDLFNGTYRLECAQAHYSGVYMPVGVLVPPVGTGEAGINPFFPQGWGGTVLPPPANITITSSGTYSVGGICLITAKYFVSGLSDTVQVEYPQDPKNHYTEDTLTVPFTDYVNGDLFYFPGCHVLHFRNEPVNNVVQPVVQDQMNKSTPLDGDWQICFAAIPGKTMTIYYYPDDEQKPINAPTDWTALVTTTVNGMSCADLVNYSAVYAPAGQ